MVFKDRSDVEIDNSRGLLGQVGIFTYAICKLPNSLTQNVAVAHLLVYIAIKTFVLSKASRLYMCTPVNII